MKYSDQAYAEAFVKALVSSTPDRYGAIRRRFVHLLAKNGDISRSDQILKLIQNIFVRKNGGRIIMVEFARPQYPATVKKILAQFSKKDHIEMAINPDLVAGVRITIDGSKQIDTSLSRKIQKLFS